MKDRNSVEVNWDLSPEELGCEDENNWAVTPADTGSAL